MFSNFKLLIFFLVFSISLSVSAKKYNYDRNKTINLIRKGADFLYDNVLDSSIVYLQNAGNVALVNQDSLLIVACYNNLGIIYSEKSDFKKSISCFQKAYQFQNNLNSAETMDNMLNMMIVYRKIGDLSQAVDIGTKLLSQLDHSQKTKILASCFNEFGIINKIQKKYDEAIEFYKRSLEIRKENKNLRGVVGSLNNIGNTYKEKGEYQSALRYLEQSLELKLANGTKKSLGTAYMNIADLQIRLKMYHEAEENLFKALFYKEKINDKSGIVATCDLFAWLYTDMKLYSKAEEYVYRAKEIAKEISSLQLQKETYLRLKNLYAAQNLGKKALFYYDKYVTVKDSLLNVNSIKHIQEMEAKYQAREKQQKIEVLNLENQNKDLLLEKSKQKNWMLFSAFVLLILVLIPSILVMKQRQKNRLLQERIAGENQECTRISRDLHDGIAGSLSHLCRSMEQEPENSAFAKQLRTITDEVRSISHNLNLEVIGKQDFKSAILDSLPLHGFSDEIDFQIHLPENFEVADYSKRINLVRVVQELVHNSLKHAQASTIVVKFSQRGEKQMLEYADDGIGMELDSEQIKSGNGNHNIRERVSILAGKMDVKTSPGEGYYFKLVF